MFEPAPPQNEARESFGPINRQIIKLSTVLQDMAIAHESKGETPTLTGAKANTLLSTAQQKIGELKTTNSPLADLLTETLLSDLHKLHPTADGDLSQATQKRQRFLSTYYSIMRCPNDPVYALGKTFQLKEQAVRTKKEAVRRGDNAEEYLANSQVVRAYQAEKTLILLVRQHKMS